MAEGGAVNTGTYQVPSNIYTQPSNLKNYQQSVAPFKPFVPPAKSPIPVVGQTQTGKGPTFEQLIPAVGGTRVTKEYRNEAGQRLFIPFINDKPIYPVPEGYTEYVTAQTPTDTKPTQGTATGTGTRTTRVQDSGDDTTDTTIRSTQVTGLGAGKPLDTNFETQSPDEAKRNLEQMKGGDRGLSVLAALEKSKGRTGLSKAIEQAGAGLVNLMAPGAMTIPMLGAQLYKAGTYNPVEAFKQIGNPDPTALNNILSAYKTADFADPSGFVDDIEAEQRAEQERLSQAMYGKSLAEITKELGVAPTFKRGRNPGDIDAETGYTFDEDGQAGGAYEVPTYASFSDFKEAMAISAKTCFVGSKATAKDVMRRNPVDSKAYKRAESFINEFKKNKEDKKPETETTPSGDSTPSGGSTGAVGSTGDLGGSTGAGYSGSQDLADSYAESGGDAGAGSDSFGDVGGDGGYATAKGGFIKKPKPKPKKMKRGGLASKK